MAGTEKQRAARDRNHRIWRLRGAWSNHGPLDHDLSKQVQDIIDLQLTRLGAEPEGVRWANRRKKWESGEFDG